MRHVAVRVTGRVQGVGFRAWTRAQAVRRGLTGFVRNEADGSVQAELSGPDAAVEEMLRLLWQGPAAARVDDVAVAPAEPSKRTEMEITR